MGGACSAYGERRDAYRVLVGKPEVKRPPGRPRHKWDDDIKIDLQEEVWGVWTGSSLSRRSAPRRMYGVSKNMVRPDRPQKTK